MITERDITLKPTDKDLENSEGTILKALEDISAMTQEDDTETDKEKVSKDTIPEALNGVLKKDLERIGHTLGAKTAKIVFEVLSDNYDLILKSGVDMDNFLSGIVELAVNEAPSVGMMVEIKPALEKYIVSALQEAA